MEHTHFKADLSAIIEQTILDPNRLERGNQFNFQEGLNTLELALNERANTLASLIETANAKASKLTAFLRNWTNDQRNIAECLHVVTMITLYATIDTYRDTPRILFHRVMGDAYAYVSQAIINNFEDDNNNLWANDTMIGVMIDDWIKAIQNEKFFELMDSASQHQGDKAQQQKLQKWAVDFLKAIA